jgi:uncharacterized membrane-anchored protein
MKKYALLFVIGMVLAQWAVPASVIMEQEDVLANGTAYKFKTRPLDPTDPFRGSYMNLSFEANNYKTDTLAVFETGEKVFVSLDTDSAGFATIKTVAHKKPTEPGDFLTARVSYSSRIGKISRQHSASPNEDKQQVFIDYPFEKYYVEESKASDAEKSYWDANAANKQVAYAIIKVKDGDSAIEDLIINGKPILEIVRAIKAAQ